MKKLFLIVGVLLASLTVNASYLLWQVADYSGDWDAVAVYLYNGSQVLYENGRLNIYAQGQPVPENVLYAENKDTLLNQTFAAEWNQTYTERGYTYYVEYYKYDSEKQDYGFTTDNKVAGGISTETTLYDSTGSVASLPSSTWAQPTATYTAVPEPTSGLLLMFGAAMLGLKRKNRSRA
jgi:hypothetical protein